MIVNIYNVWQRVIREVIELQLDNKVAYQDVCLQLSNS